MRLRSCPCVVIETTDYAQYLRVLGDVSNPALLDLKGVYITAWLRTKE